MNENSYKIKVMLFAIVLFAMFLVTIFFLNKANNDAGDEQEYVVDVYTTADIEVDFALNGFEFAMVKTTEHIVGYNENATDDYEEDNEYEEIREDTSEEMVLSTATSEDQDWEIQLYEDDQEMVPDMESVQDNTSDTTEHIHDFVQMVSYISHPEEGHYETVCVSQGYEEEVYESYNKYCYQCGEVMDEWSVQQLLDHSALHGSYGSYTEVVESIWHEPVYEDKWIIDKEAYEEEVIERRCIECGYVE